MDGRSMNSLEVSRKSPALLDGAPFSPGKPASGVDGNFLSLLTAAGAADPGTDTTPSEATVKNAPGSGQAQPSKGDTSGRELPESGKNGKSLPLRLPAVAAAAVLSRTAPIGTAESAVTQSTGKVKGEGPAKTPGRAKPGSDDAVDEQKAATVLAISSLPSIVPSIEAATDKSEASGDGDAAAGQSFAGSASKGELSFAGNAVSKEGLKLQTAESSDSRAVAVHFAEASAQPSTAAGQAEGASPGKAARALEARRADAAAQSLEMPAIVSSTPTALPVHAAPTHIETGINPGSISVAAVTSDPAQDLTQIVDRLAAAREALAPATAALAINHSEFGELSLRFDQQRDGHLAVHIAASNPEAQRAMVVAASQQPSFGTSDDRSTGSEHLAQSHARGAAGGRDGAGHGGTDTQGQPQQRRASSQDGRSTKPDHQRRGVFA